MQILHFHSMFTHSRLFHESRLVHFEVKTTAASEAVKLRQSERTLEEVRAERNLIDEQENDNRDSVLEKIAKLPDELRGAAREELRRILAPIDTAIRVAETAFNDAKNQLLTGIDADINALLGNSNANTPAIKAIDTFISNTDTARETFTKQQSEQVRPFEKQIEALSVLNHAQISTNGSNITIHKDVLSGIDFVNWEAMNAHNISLNNLQTLNENLNGMRNQKSPVIINDKDGVMFVKQEDEKYNAISLYNPPYGGNLQVRFGIQTDEINNNGTLTGYKVTLTDINPNTGAEEKLELKINTDGKISDITESGSYELFSNLREYQGQKLDSLTKHLSSKKNDIPATVEVRQFHGLTDAQVGLIQSFGLRLQGSKENATFLLPNRRRLILNNKGTTEEIRLSVVGEGDNQQLKISGVQINGTIDVIIINKNGTIASFEKQIPQTDIDDNAVAERLMGEALARTTTATPAHSTSEATSNYQHLSQLATSIRTQNILPTPPEQVASAPEIAALTNPEKFLLNRFLEENPGLKIETGSSDNQIKVTEGTISDFSSLVKMPNVKLEVELKKPILPFNESIATLYRIHPQLIKQMIFTDLDQNWKSLNPINKAYLIYRNRENLDKILINDSNSITVTNANDIFLMDTTFTNVELKYETEPRSISLPKVPNLNLTINDPTNKALKLAIQNAEQYTKNIGTLTLQNFSYTGNADVLKNATTIKSLKIELNNNIPESDTTTIIDFLKDIRRNQNILEYDIHFPTNWGPEVMDAVLHTEHNKCIIKYNSQLYDPNPTERNFRLYPGKTPTVMVAEFLLKNMQDLLVYENLNLKIKDTSHTLSIEINETNGMMKQTAKIGNEAFEIPQEINRLRQRITKLQESSKIESMIDSEPAEERLQNRYINDFTSELADDGSVTFTLRRSEGVESALSGLLNDLTGNEFNNVRVQFDITGETGAAILETLNTRANHVTLIANDTAQSIATQNNVHTEFNNSTYTKTIVDLRSFLGASAQLSCKNFPEVTDNRENRVEQQKRMLLEIPETLTEIDFKGFDSARTDDSPLRFLQLNNGPADNLTLKNFNPTERLYINLKYCTSPQLTLEIDDSCTLDSDAIIGRMNEFRESSCKVNIIVIQKGNNETTYAISDDRNRWNKNAPEEAEVPELEQGTESLPTEDSTPEPAEPAEPASEPPVSPPEQPLPPPQDSPKIERDIIE